MSARQHRCLTWLLPSAAAGLLLAALLAPMAHRHPVPIVGLQPPSTLAVNLVNFGQPLREVGVFHRSPDPRDPVLTFYWQDPATLEQGVLEVLQEAEARHLDGTWRDGPHRAAVDLIFASTHSARTRVKGEQGEVVGEIVVDRSQPSPARAGMREVLERLAQTHRSRFLHTRIHTVFLLSCGSRDDTEDQLLLHRVVEALTGRPPAHVLTTSGKVSPDYRHITAGHATGRPFTILDARPGPTGLRLVPFLHVGEGGYLNLAHARGVGLSRPAGVPLEPGLRALPPGPPPRAVPGCTTPVPTPAWSRARHDARDPR